LDNIVKPLLDSMGGLVFENDTFIKRLAVDDVLVQPNRNLDLSLTGLHPKLAGDLLFVLAGGHPDIIYAEIGPLTAQPLVFGRVPCGDTWLKA
jgi:hypothetical protein